MTFKAFRRLALPVVSCDGCGVCCTEMGLLPAGVYVGNMVGADRDPATVPPELLAELRQAIADYRLDPKHGDQPCIWYDAATKKCKHHEHRPNICRDMKVGGSSCLGWRNSKLLPSGSTAKLSIVAGKVVRR